MAEPFRFAVVEPSGQLDVRTTPGTDTRAMLTALQTAVGGGYVEPIPLPAGSVPGLLAFVNEDGHALDLPANPSALPILAALGVRLAYPVILGPLVFTGSTRHDSGTLTDPQLDVIRNLHRSYAVT